ncbi:hypothetical protein C9I98_04325 [Photobacterium sanctipauli]|uniref:Uncharacterized protein n=1 Tax=Photobacterium sanctipauli TaxID=1342794 RepID=A0A2T3NY15_9GAMM|nr:hypothetical protein [Photobacterium sanctipauli]PSW21184.1 hypothetical protein C9I98_04325 [Photobacterium sanctipauli]
MKRVLFLGMCVGLLYGCSTASNGYDWAPGDDIETTSSGEVVAPEAIVLPQEDIDAINQL